MKVLLSRLDECFITKPNWEDVWPKLTMAGLELESITSIAPEFTGVIVAEVLSCEKVTGADKLNLCSVNLGNNNIVNIICGASNVRVGIKVACATVGAILPNNFIITKREMRGITSNGMICSAEELGLKELNDGILILPSESKVGLDVRKLLNLDDKIIEFKITPNRGDCLSVNGIAREVSVLTGHKLKNIFSKKLGIPTINDKINIQISDKNLCPNYCSLIIRNITNTVVLPDIIKHRLINCGYNSISPLVDLANYVTLETGQPLHIFDLDKVKEPLTLRDSKHQEKLVLLDKTEVSLKENTPVISDSTGSIIAVSGVMGSLESCVTQNTTNILIESAYFPPAKIAGTMKLLGVHSEAAYRFERGTDYSLPLNAIQLLGSLILEICGGDLSLIQNIKDDNFRFNNIHLSYSFINKLIGFDLSNDTVNNILENLGFKIKINLDELEVTPPSFRSDIKIKEDVVEEIIRVYGYDNIPPILPNNFVNFDASLDKFDIQDKLKNTMINFGFTEVINYSFIEEKYQSIFNFNQLNPIKLKNSIANFNVMRTSLFGGLIKNLITNLNRGQKQVKIFEIAKVFYGEDSLSQPLKIAGLAYGDFIYPNIEDLKRDFDFYDLKRIVESILIGLNDINYESVKDNPLFHSGRCAKISFKNLTIGIIGQLHPQIGNELGLIKCPYLFEIDADSIFIDRKITKFSAISKFQKVERDISFVIDKNINVGKLLEALNEEDIEYLKELYVFDVYNLENNKKNVAIRCIFQGEKTLADEDTQLSVAKMIKYIIDKFPNSLLRE